MRKRKQILAAALAGFAAGNKISTINLEEMFLSMVDKDNAGRKQRAGRTYRRNCR